MKKLLLIGLLLCLGCDNQSPKLDKPLPKQETVGQLDRCAVVKSFIDGDNKCYIVDYCGSSNATISCVKNNVASSK